MNHFSKTILAISISTMIGFSSCIGEKDLSIPQPETYSEVELHIGGECSTTETPMRSTTGNIEGIYGITVSQWVKDANGRSLAKPYAYGIFDNVSNLKLNLLDGYKYRVSCTMIENAKDSIRFVNEGYGRPFTLDRAGETYGPIQNKFLVADQPDGSQFFLFDGDNSKVETQHQNKEITRPFIQRYHGIIDSLETHTVGNEIELYRRYFAVKFVANGLQPDCRLEIQLDDSPKWILTPEKNETNYTYVSCKSLTGKIVNNVILSESPRFKVELFKGNESKGVIMEYNKNFKRNYKSVVTISDIDHFGSDAGISIAIKDEGELENDIDVDLPWQGGNKQ